MQRLAMANLEWMVVRDFSLIESATWWKDGPEIESGELRTDEIGTEMFFFPSAVAHREVRQLHQHQPPAAVAFRRGRAGR